VFVECLFIKKKIIIQGVGSSVIFLPNESSFSSTRRRYFYFIKIIFLFCNKNKI